MIAQPRMKVFALPYIIKITFLAKDNIDNIFNKTSVVANYFISDVFNDKCATISNVISKRTILTMIKYMLPVVNDIKVL